SFEWFFGLGYFLLPVSLVFFAIGLMRVSESETVGGARLVGAALLFASGIALLSVVGGSGGVAGALIAKPFISLFDKPFSALALAAIAVAGSLIALDTPISFSKITLLWNWIRAKNIDAPEPL